MSNVMVKQSWLGILAANPLGKTARLFIKINTGAKYDSRSFQEIEVGLNGVGIKAVNAFPISLTSSRSGKSGRPEGLNMPRVTLRLRIKRIRRQVRKMER